MVFVGETVIDEPETGEPLRVRVGVGFPETDQESVLDWPLVIFDGEGEKEEMVGLTSAVFAGIKATAPIAHQVEAMVHDMVVAPVADLLETPQYKYVPAGPLS